MKRIKFYLVALCILSAGIASAAPASFQERTENWLQRSSSDTPTENPPVEPTGDSWDTAPIGDALPFLLALCLIYAAGKNIKMQNVKCKMKETPARRWLCPMSFS
jgi:hypothetical protein